METLIANIDSFKDFLRPEIIWTLVGLALLLLELMLPGLIVFFFGMGAFVVALVSAFTPITLEWQLGIFIISSVAMLLCLRHLLKKVFMGTQTSINGMNENLSEYIGQQAVVKGQIAPGKKGKVEFHGTDWTAESEHTIEPGITVEIVGQNNIVLKVKPI